MEDEDVTLGEVDLSVEPGAEPKPDDKPAEDAKPEGQTPPPKAPPDGAAALATLLANPAMASLLDLKLEGEITPEAIAALPTEAKQAVAAVLRQVSAAKSGLDARANEAREAERRAAEQQRRALADRAGLGATAKGKQAQAHLAMLEKEAKGDGLPVAPDSIEGLRREFAQRQLDYMRQFFEALEKDATTTQAELTRQTQIEKVAAFMEQHPDDFFEDSPGFDAQGRPTPFPDVVRSFTQRGLSIEEAYATADALRLRHAPPPPPDTKAVGKGGPSLQRVQMPPDDLEGEALGQWFHDHPEAAKALAAME